MSWFKKRVETVELREEELKIENTNLQIGFTMAFEEEEDFVKIGLSSTQHILPEVTAHVSTSESSNLSK